MFPIQIIFWHEYTHKKKFWFKEIFDLNRSTQYLVYFSHDVHDIHNRHTICTHCLVWIYCMCHSTKVSVSEVEELEPCTAVWVGAVLRRGMTNWGPLQARIGPWLFSFNWNRDERDPVASQGGLKSIVGAPMAAVYNGLQNPTTHDAVTA